MEINQPKIHIIANCANRKRKPPSLELGSIKQSNLEKRARGWWEKLINLSVESLNNKEFFGDGERLKAVDLYVGSYWANIRRLLTETHLAGFETNFWIVSAGYGLISSDEKIHSYSATFTQGDKNSIDNDKNLNEKPSEVSEKWWELISHCSLPNSNHPRKLTELINENSNDYFLIIASGNYLSAIKKDLIEGSKLLSSPENLLIITSKSFSDETLQKNIIAADARLQCNGDCKEGCVKHLIPKGICGAISSSLAIKIIERVKEFRYGKFNNISAKGFC
jgi:hypothetical protein